MIKALGHPLRLRIIAILCLGPCNVSELTEQLEARQSVVSQQLRILRNQRLVRVERSNGFANYRLGQDRLKDLVSCIEGCNAV
jgi:ArsR family transcriptional regulator